MDRVQRVLSHRAVIVAMAILGLAVLCVAASGVAAQDVPSTLPATAPAGEAAPAAEREHHAAPHVSLWWSLPFVLLLLCVASVPAYDHHLWEKIYPYVAIGLGLVTGIYYMFFHPELANSRYAWLHEMREYASFILLLGSLYTVSGGIVIGITRQATPLTNCVLLLVGGVIANLVGTTGAAMLLIRPFIRINREHIKPYHVVFFIFIVANCGGSLTPIGDPPLFMGFLKGVPFFWTAHALWPMWALVLGLLLVMFFVIDTLDHRKTARAHPPGDAGPAVSIFGFQNFLFVGLILVAVFQRSAFEHIDDRNWAGLLVSREGLMLLAAVASKLSTKASIYQRNEFTWGPIREVAILFVGIFSTMVPALNWLSHNADRLPARSASQYYFITGVLSSFLDNAPTYLVFLEASQVRVQEYYGDKIEALKQAVEQHGAGGAGGKLLPPAVEQSGDPDVIDGYEILIDYHRRELAAGTLDQTDYRIAMTLASERASLYLIAISIGAVFFGAATYIGNGPNFMVKSIAEAQGVPMPTFFGYVVRYTVPFLLPILLLVWFLFFYLELGLLLT